MSQSLVEFCSVIFLANVSKEAAHSIYEGWGETQVLFYAVFRPKVMKFVDSVEDHL